MKVTVIKGSLFEHNEKRVYEHLGKILRKQASNTKSCSLPNKDCLGYNSDKKNGRGNGGNL